VVGVSGPVVSSPCVVVDAIGPVVIVRPVADEFPAPSSLQPVIIHATPKIAPALHPMRAIGPSGHAPVGL